MAAKVKELTGAEMMASLWPSVEDSSENYAALQEQGLLATTRDGTGVTDSFAGAYTRLSELCFFPSKGVGCMVEDRGAR